MANRLYQAPRGCRLSVPLPAKSPAALADEAGERGLPSRLNASVYDGIDPVDGWTLLTFPEDDSDGFSTAAYAARPADPAADDVILNVCRFRFSPSQERFAWLVRNGFPPSRTIGPWNDTEIEHELALGSAVSVSA